MILRSTSSPLTLRQLIIFIIIIICNKNVINGQRDTICPSQEIILPCRCSNRGSEIQIWCSHSDLPRVLSGLKSVAKSINRPIDELILENNYLPSLPSRVFAPLQILRLMLRHNGLERLSSGWLNDLENSLVEIFIVERDLRSVPADSLFGLKNLEAVTIQSDNLKRAPEFSGLPKLRHINIESSSLLELSPQGFRELLNLEAVHITGSSHLTRLEAGLFHDLPKLNLINLSSNGIDWIHLRTFVGLPSLKFLEFSGNRISNAGMIGRGVKDLPNLEVIKLDKNLINVLNEGSFVDLPSLRELYLNDNIITEIFHGAFHRTPKMKLVHLENNLLRRVHPESFLQASGSGVEVLHLQHNDIGRIEELRSLLDALPMLRFLDLSYNKLEEIPFGALRGHGTLEQLYLDHNRVRMIHRDAFMAMPGLRELRLKNNSLSDLLPMPFWNLPGLKGIDISDNQFRRIEPVLLMGVPSLRRLDISGNYLTIMDPASFVNTPMLETVNISHNQIALLHPGTFRNLNRLFEIDAGYNNLQEMIPGLPKAIERINVQRNKISSLPLPPSKALDLPNLRMFDLSGNVLQRLPRSTFKTLGQLRVLSLAKNRLQTIDEDSLSGLSNLEYLNLQDNRIIALHERSTITLENLKELNVQGNRLEVLIDQIIKNVPKLERLDVSKNNIVEIAPNSFRNSRSLQTLDLSNNNLRELPESLSSLSELKELDVSYNQLTSLSPNILASCRNLEDLKASNNRVSELQQGSFRNLPLLQYLDLSNNELSVLEQGSIRNLPELQELVLANNKLPELRERIFEDLPNLQAVHLQQNNLRGISPNSFYRSPSIVYLNLSTNSFRNFDSIGLRSVRNIEVLDLSNNGIKRISSNPLRGLDWLVELKLDDNRICGIQGEPFAAMPRLRVLSMKNNRMSSIPEGTFRSLRGNIAVLDFDGNPLDCSCNMLWLRAWLQETESHYPGPRCRDGTMLRDARLSRSECINYEKSNSNSNSNNNNNLQIPLTNEHGDVFQRDLNSGDFDECGRDNLDDYQVINSFNNLPPTPEESEYFYDQYIDYPYHLNETGGRNGTSNSSNSDRVNASQVPQQITDFNQNKFNLGPNHHNQHPPQNSQSPFTFFGVPIPSLNIGKIWGAGRNVGNTRSQIGTRGKGRVQIYRPGDVEFNKIFKKTEIAEEYLEIPKNQSDDSLYSAETEQKLSQQNKNELNSYYRPVFQTPFLQTIPQTERGGFTPMMPGSITGGFRPISVSNESPNINNTGTDKKWLSENFQELVPLVTESITKPNEFEKNRLSKAPPSEQSYQQNRPEIYRQKYYGAVNNTPPVVEISPPKINDTFLATTSASTLGTSAEVSATIPPTTTQSTTVTSSTVTTTTTTPSAVTSEENASVSDKRNNFFYEQQQHKNNFETDSKEEIASYTTNSKESELFDTYNHNPSSLSALVAPGAQQGIYRSPHITGRTATITKVHSPSPPPSVQIKPLNYDSKYSPAAASGIGSSSPSPSRIYNDRFENDNNNFNTLIDEIDLNDNSNKRTNDMEWYFANYNRTSPVNFVLESGLNSYRSNGCNQVLGHSLKFTLILIIISNIM